MLGDHVLLERASPLTFKAMTRCELLVLGDKGLAEQVKQHLGKPERTRLASDVVRETCRKMRLRYLTMRVALTRLRENKAQGTTRRTQAVLVIQAAQVRRLARPSAYSTTTFEERWGPIGSLHVGRKNSLPGSPTSSSPARSPQPARSQQPAAQCVPTSFAHAARAKLPPVKLPANMLANSFSKSQAAHFQGASAIPEGPPPLIRAPAAWPSAETVPLRPVARPSARRDRSDGTSAKREGDAKAVAASLSAALQLNERVSKLDEVMREQLEEAKGARAEMRALTEALNTRLGRMEEAMKYDFRFQGELAKEGSVKYDA